MAMTCEELNVAFTENVKNALVQVVGSLKTYIDGQDEVLKTELEQVIVEKLSGIDGLAENLEKLNELSAGFVSVFDENADGNVTAEEIIAKIALLQSAIDKVDARVTSLEELVNSVKTEIEGRLADLEAKVDANTIAIAQNRDGLAEVKADLANNYVSKECLEGLVAIDTQSIADAVSGILFPTTEDTTVSDGAVE